MSSEALKCPKCNCVMERGFDIDNSYGARLVSHWAAGRPKSSLWMGTKLPAEGQIPIGTFRCESCGYLESYARNEFRAE